MAKKFKINKYHKYLKFSIKEDLIFLDSFFSSSPNGELYWFIKEIEERYTGLKIIISIRKDEKISEDLLKNKSIQKIVKRESILYYKYLATCKFLLTDMTFPFGFIKRENQVYFNTWHGTPWKRLGLSSRVKGKYSNISNAQKNFYLADGFVFNNDFSRFTIGNEYSITNFIKENHIYSYFLKNQRPIQSTNDIVFLLYTWRNEYLSKKNKRDHYLNQILYIDDLISSYKKTDFYISIHHTLNTRKNRKWLKNKIQNLKLVNGYETNSLIAKSKSIITDYSSSIFDASFMEKKIIINKADIDNYRRNTGLYNLVELWNFNNLDVEKPSIFSVVDTINEAIAESVLDEKVQYKNFNAIFNKYEYSNINWVDMFISFQKNKKERILIYPGALFTNGITTSFINTINLLLEEKKTVVVFLSKLYNKKSNVLMLRRKFGNRIDIIFSDHNVRFGKINNFKLNFIKKSFFTKKIFKKWMDNFFLYERRRIFGDLLFSEVINFSGYEWYISGLFDSFEDHVKKTIYVHNDMISEFKYKKNYSKTFVFSSYDKSGTIVFPSEWLSINMANKSKYFKRNIDKFFILPNPIYISEEASNNNEINEMLFEKNIKRIINNNNNKYYNLQSIYSILFSSEVKKIVFLGRTSYEKNILLALQSFIKYNKNFNNSSFFFILGAKTGKKVKFRWIYNFKYWYIINHSKYKKNIIRLSGIQNDLVFRLLPLFDVMLFLSRYEGQGLSAIEAAMSGIPVISSKIGTNFELEKEWSQIVTIDSDPNKISKEINKKINNKILYNSNDYHNYRKKVEEAFSRKYDENI